jgi:large subunit ribosomal protein L32
VSSNILFFVDFDINKTQILGAHHGRSAKQKIAVAANVIVDNSTGEAGLRHHISPNGMYRGRQVIKPKQTAAE